jgi:hypothetical protein
MPPGNDKESQIQKALRELKKQEFFDGYKASDIRKMKSAQQLINEGLDAVEHDQYRFSVGVVNTAIRRLAVQTYNQNQPKLNSTTRKKKA